MKYLGHFFLFAFILFFQNSRCQEHLEPTESVFDMYDFQFEYQPKIREVLFKDLDDAPEARFLILPSFNGEIVIDITNEQGKYTLEYRKAESSIWYSLSNKKVKIKVKSAKKVISIENAELIINVFQKSIKQVRYPEAEVMGLDGTNYYFSSRNKSGTIWSPKTGSKMSRLVGIGNDLITFCFNTDAEFDKDFIDRIKKLTEEL